MSHFQPFNQTIQPLGGVLPVPSIEDAMVEQVVAGVWQYAASKPTVRLAYSVFASNADHQRVVLETEEQQGWGSELTEKLIFVLDFLANECGKMCGGVTA